jgi:hypothetical protein
MMNGFDAVKVELLESEAEKTHQRLGPKSLSPDVAPIGIPDVSPAKVAVVDSDTGGSDHVRALYYAQVILVTNSRPGRLCDPGDPLLRHLKGLWWRRQET